MGDLRMLTTGPVSPVVATIFAGLGCLLSILLLTRARQHTGWRRVRLVTYAIPALALPAIFLPALVTVLGMRVEGSVLLLAPAPLGYSLAAAVGGTALALVVVCFGQPGFVRQVLSGALLFGAIGGTAVFLAASLTTGLPIGVRVGPTGAALALTCVVALGLATALAATRTLRWAVGSGALLGLALTAIYHVAGAGLTLRPLPGGPIPADDVVGLSPQRVGLPAVAVIVVVLTFVWYFTLGTATIRDLHRMFEPGADAEEIEPWIVEQVRRRVAHTVTVTGADAGPDEQPVEAVTIHAVAIVGRDTTNAIAHRARAALPTGASPTSLSADGSPTGAHTMVPAPDPAGHSVDGDADPDRSTDEPTGEVGHPNGPSTAFDIDTDEWPGGRNEPAAVRLGVWSGNSRFGFGPDDDGSDPFGDMDPDAWAERLTAARAAAGHGRAPQIVYDYRAGSPLPRRNIHPIHRP